MHQLYYVCQLAGGFYALLVLAVICGITPAQADCTSPAGVASQTRYDGVENKLYYCNDTDWVEMGGSGGGGAPTCRIEDSGSSTASCSAGETMVGGGCRGSADYNLYRVYPSSTNSFSCSSKNTGTDAYAICCTFSGGGGVSCPAGFTKVESAGRALGCIQNAEQGAALPFAANNDCFTTYGGRLPLFMEIKIAFDNYTLTDETDDREITADAVDAQCSNITETGVNVGDGDCNNTEAYRCFIPN